ncbi:MAG: cobalamin-dependent protein [Phycisphaerales bacterium]|jgi:5-methyltetrahydrofolate--homocysteine methyltransferase|nr:cobalamin-dependent protein [Phycisphaerales bacterium]
MAEFQTLADVVSKGNRAEAKRLTQSMIDAGVAPSDVLDNGLIPGMTIIGNKFKNNEAFVPEMLIAARAMKEAMTILEPLLVGAGIKPKYTAVIGTVQGDLHDIGKNLVALMWKGANIGVVDLGTNVPPAKFVAAAKEHNAQIVGLSALLTTTMTAMQATIQAIRDAGLPDVKVMIGGAPVTQEFANRIGADGFAADAATAVERAIALIEGAPAVA